MRRTQKPLYRKVNTRTHGVRHGAGGKFRWDRNTKAAKRDTGCNGSMHSHHRHGLDYTPLFQFLLSRVGHDWSDTHSEALSRLDRAEPIFWLVALNRDTGQPVVRTGENSYFSGLYVDDTGRLALVDPTLTPDTMRPFCPCCTHSLNGHRLTLTFDSPATDAPNHPT